MKKKMYLMAMTLMMSAVVNNKIWADGEDPIPFIMSDYPSNQ